MLRKFIFSFLVAILLLPASLVAQRYTVLVSLDGFRNDYTRAYRTPFLDRMATLGVSATMQPSFPP